MQQPEEPHETYGAVGRTQEIKFNVPAIGAQLREDGVLVPGKDNLTVQRSVRGAVSRFWRLRAGCLVGDSSDT